APLAPARAHRRRRRPRPHAARARPQRGRRAPPRRGPREVRHLMLPLAATGADTTVIAAFAVGFVSFISPCVLPLVPGYLSAVSGVSITDIREGRHNLSHVLGPAVVFCL